MDYLRAIWGGERQAAILGVKRAAALDCLREATVVPREVVLALVHLANRSVFREALVVFRLTRVRVANRVAQPVLAPGAALAQVAVRPVREMDLVLARAVRRAEAVPVATRLARVRVPAAEVV